MKTRRRLTNVDEGTKQQARRRLSATSEPAAADFGGGRLGFRGWGREKAEQF